MCVCVCDVSLWEKRRDCASILASVCLCAVCVSVCVCA